MAKEEDVEALPPGVGPSDRELFEEIAGKPALDLRLLLESASEDEEHKGYCGTTAAEFERLAEELRAAVGRPRSGLKEAETQLLQGAGDYVLDLSQTTVDALAKLPSFADRGDAIDAVGELLACAFYIGKFTQPADRIGVDRKRGRIPVARRRIAAKLKEMYPEDPIAGGSAKKIVLRQEIAKSLGLISISESTLDRARDLAWNSDEI